MLINKAQHSEEKKQQVFQVPEDKQDLRIRCLSGKESWCWGIWGLGKYLSRRISRIIMVPAETAMAVAKTRPWELNIPKNQMLCTAALVLCLYREAVDSTWRTQLLIYTKIAISGWLGDTQKKKRNTKIMRESGNFWGLLCFAFWSVTFWNKMQKGSGVGLRCQERHSRGQFIGFRFK